MTIHVDVKITTGVDLSNFKSRLDGPALTVFESTGREMLQGIQNQWTGWKYKGRNLATTGRSERGWASEYQATEGIRTITFTNKARGHYSGKKYAGYVARKKGAKKEWIIARDMLIRDHVPKLIKRVTEAIHGAMTGGRRVKVRTNKSTTFTALTLED